MILCVFLVDVSEDHGVVRLVWPGSVFTSASLPSRLKLKALRRSEGMAEVVTMKKSFSLLDVCLEDFPYSISRQIPVTRWSLEHKKGWCNR
jgi:hypothetical protein